MRSLSSHLLPGLGALVLGAATLALPLSAGAAPAGQTKSATPTRQAPTTTSGGASTSSSGTTAQASLPSLPSVTYNEAHPVLAYYYAWWDPADFVGDVFQNPQPYNSDDSAVIAQQVGEAEQAGIDGFVVSWYGNGDRTDRNLGTLLALGAQSGFRASIHFETPHFWGVDDVVAQLQALYAGKLSSPAWVTYQGRPVIFFWRASTFDNSTWNAIRQQVDPDHRAIWLADGDQFGILAGDAWDGISPYAIAWSANPASQLPSWGAKAAPYGKLYVPPVSPGCDDHLTRPVTCIQDRQGGAYYDAAWQGALASNPAWAVIVNTFNEWKESTQIEPATEYGTQYLQMTRSYADAFKGTSDGITDPGADSGGS